MSAGRDAAFPAIATRPRVAAIVLAAGRSTRMAGQHKLLAPFDDRTVLGCSVDAVLASGVDGTIVVLGHDADRVGASLGTRPVVTVLAPDHAAGLSASLRAGIAALPPGVAGVLIQLGDMPLIRSTTIDRVLDRFRAALAGDDRAIVRPSWGGEAGHPVLWSTRHAPDLAATEGDRGGQAILAGRGAAHLLVHPVDDRGVLIDVDTAAALADAGAILAQRRAGRATRDAPHDAPAAG